MKKYCKVCGALLADNMPVCTVCNTDNSEEKRANPYGNMNTYGYSSDNEPVHGTASAPTNNFTRSPQEINDVNKPLQDNGLSAYADPVSHSYGNNGTAHKQPDTQDIHFTYNPYDKKACNEHTEVKKEEIGYKPSASYNAVQNEMPQTDKNENKKNKDGDKKEKKKKKKRKRIFLRIIAWLLAVVILVSFALSVLVYFDIANIPFIRNILEAFGVVPPEAVDTSVEFNVLSGNFTKVRITDEDSAKKAAEDAAKYFRLDVKQKDFTVESIREVGGSTYYKLQQKYKDVQVYGRTMIIVADESGQAEGVTTNIVDIPDDVSTEYIYDEPAVEKSVEDTLEAGDETVDITDVEISEPSEENVYIYNLDTLSNQEAPKVSMVFDANITFKVNQSQCSCEMLINLEDSSVIEIIPYLYESTACYNADGTKSFNGTMWQGDYVMHDMDRNIYIYNAQKNATAQRVGGILTFIQGTTVPVLSRDAYFGNTEAEQHEEYDRAYSLLENLSAVYDFYYERYSENGPGRMLGIYNDMFDNGNNAVGGGSYIYDMPIDSSGLVGYSDTDDMIGVVSMGVKYSEVGTQHIDILGHEYTHMVSRHIVNWRNSASFDPTNIQTVYRYDEAGAINEGYSDTMGLLIEASADGNCDWRIANTRNAANPEEFGYPSRVDTGEKHISGTGINGQYKFTVLNSNKNQTTSDYTHKYCTVVSHGAYLMNTGIDGKYEKLNLEEIADLYYKSMHLLPQNCTFVAWRECMEMTADILGFSTEKKQCISAVMDELGIKPQEQPVHSYDINSVLTVTDKNGAVYDDYTVQIEGRERSITAFNKEVVVQKAYNETFTVNDAMGLELDLEPGRYTITVTDGNDPANKAAIEINAVLDGIDNCNIVTNFGFDYDVSTEAEIIVYDMNDAVCDNYTVSVDGITDTGKEYTNEIDVTETKSQELGLGVGKYEITLTDGYNSNKTKQFKIRVRNNGVKTIKVSTGFGKKLGEFDSSNLAAEAVEYNGHYYYIYSDQSVTWEEARSLCEQNNGYLVTITSEDEQRFLEGYIEEYTQTEHQKLIEEQNAEVYYDGAKNILDDADLLSDKEEAKLAEIISGISRDYNGVNVVIHTVEEVGDTDLNTYSIDVAAENGYGTEFVMIIYGKDKLFGVYGSGAGDYPAAVVFDATDEQISDYLIDEEYYKAFKKCCNICIDALGEPTFVQVERPKYDLWIGATDQVTEGAWEWVTGEKYSYEKWGDGQPDDTGNQDYAYLTNYNIGENSYSFSLNAGEWDDDDAYDTRMYICEWGEYELEDDELIKPQKDNVIMSGERDIVLVLDVSGSMEGEPMEQTKIAAVEFIETVLNEDASIAIVEYASYANVCSDFTVDKAQLIDTVNSLGAWGSTNIDDGLTKASELLEKSNAESKIIVLMSDGEPNESRVGEELIDFSDTIKESGISIYTLGFFQSLSYKADAQYLMEHLASEGLHYEVANADDLVFFFGDIADQISGQQYIYVRIECPVDVIVEYNGEVLDSRNAYDAQRTSFGTMTFEEHAEDDSEYDDYSEYESDDYDDSYYDDYYYGDDEYDEYDDYYYDDEYQNDEEDGSDKVYDNRIKVLRLKADEDYDIRIEGNGEGTMNYTIGFMGEDGEYSDFREFEDIEISTSTIIETEAAYTDTTVLRVDDDGDGVADYAYEASANSKGKKAKIEEEEEDSDNGLITKIVVIGAAASVVILIVVIAVVESKKRSAKERANKSTPENNEYRQEGGIYQQQVPNYPATGEFAKQQQAATNINATESQIINDLGSVNSQQESNETKYQED